MNPATGVCEIALGMIFIHIGIIGRNRIKQELISDTSCFKFSCLFFFNCCLRVRGLFTDSMTIALRVAVWEGEGVRGREQAITARSPGCPTSGHF